MNNATKSILKQKSDKLISLFAAEINAGNASHAERICKKYLYSSKAERLRFQNSAIKILPLIYAVNDGYGTKLALRIINDIVSIRAVNMSDSMYELSRHLEYSSYYTQTNHAKSELVALLYNISYALFEISDTKSNIRYNAFSNLASEKRWSQYYSGEISDLLRYELMQIISGAEQTGKRREFALITLKEFLKGEFRFSENSGDYNVTINSYTILPSIIGWEPRVNIIELIKSNIRLIPSDLMDTFADCMERFIGDCNRGSRSINENTDPSLFFRKQLEWYFENALNGDINISDYALRKFRSSWKWFYEWSNNTALKEMATKCEHKYFGEPNYEKYKALFDFNNRENAQLVENEIAEEIIESDDKEYFRKILNAIRKVSDYPNESHQYFGLINKVCSSESFNKTAISYILEYINSIEDKPFIQIATNSVLKWHRINARNSIAEILESLAGTAINRAELISMLYSNFNPSIVGEFTDDDLNFIRLNLTSDTIYESIVAVTSLSFTHWDSVREIIELNWNKLTPAQQSNLVYSLTEKMHHLMLIREAKIPNERLEWLIRRCFYLHDIDSISSCSYSFREILKHNNFSLSIKELAVMLERRFDEFDKLKIRCKLPYRFTELYSAFKPSNDECATSDFCLILDQYRARHDEQWMFGKIFPSIDPSGELVAAGINMRIDAIESYPDLIAISSIAGFYQDTSPGWEQIAVACLRKSRDFIDANAKEIYSSLRWNGVRSYSGKIDEIAPQYFDELNHATSRLNASPVELIEYWQQEVGYCNASIERAKAELPIRLNRDA